MVSTNKPFVRVQHDDDDIKRIEITLPSSVPNNSPNKNCITCTFQNNKLIAVLIAYLDVKVLVIHEDDKIVLGNCITEEFVGVSNENMHGRKSFGMKGTPNIIKLEVNNIELVYVGLVMPNNNKISMKIRQDGNDSGTHKGMKAKVKHDDIDVYMDLPPIESIIE